MPVRYLFGPAAPGFAERHLSAHRRAGLCRYFNPTEGADVTITPAHTWEEVARQFPEDWQPDCVVLHLAFTSIPLCLWSAPVPLVGLAPDWRTLWHYYRHCLPACDLVLTDRAGVDVMAREHYPHVWGTDLFALAGGPRPERDPAAERDTDVLILGEGPTDRERPLFALLTRLGRRRTDRRITWWVPGGEELTDALACARIVLAPGRADDRDPLTHACADAGALLLRAGDDPGKRLERLLEDEQHRRAEVIRVRERLAREGDFATVWEGFMEKVEATLGELRERSGGRVSRARPDDLPSRTWQALCTPDPLGDPFLIDELAGATVRHPGAAELHNALGVLLAREGAGPGPLRATAAERSVEHFRRATLADPCHVLAGLNLAEALAALQQDGHAVEQARRTLDSLEARDETDLSGWDAPHFPPVVDVFRAEWERAAWYNAGDREAEVAAKKALIRWRLHTLLASLTEGQGGGDLVPYHEAALARPDLPGSLAALGCALARAGRVTEALSHLGRAVAEYPFDRDAARALFHALGEAGNDRARRRLARDRHRLAQIAPAAIPVEPWFEVPAPVGDELASIIIPCCNEAACTRLCLDSLLRNTRPPYELILVDNGSTDETPALLEEVRGMPGPLRVEVVRNDTNRGFAAACNQGLAKAQGRYLVLLNNDTVVTPGWLDGLIRWALHEWSPGGGVGLVGAVTNYGRPPQQVVGDYADLAGLEDFAARNRRDHAGEAAEAERLGGFCLLMRRDVYEEVEGFDEQYRVGFFEDDDLCVRVRQAGYRLLAALDVFIHHSGSRTFAALGIDPKEQLRENFARFKAKWGEEHARGYRLPGEEGLPAPAEESSRARVSLCLIVRDEEANLPDCLGPVRGLFDEVVVVDTGSTDGTRAVAEGLGARVFESPWRDSFAEARNASLDHATGEWVFWLDADDRLDNQNIGKLRNLLASLPSGGVAYSMKCLCLPDPETGTATVVDHVRLFPNHPRLRWRYRIHEQILPALRGQGVEVRFADVVIHHTGYRDAALRRRKLDRDLRLLRLEQQDDPDDPFTLFNLGSVYQEMGRYAEALPLLQRSLEGSHPRDSIVRKLHALIVGCHRALGRAEEALAACQRGRQDYPDDTELLFVEGVLRRERDDLPGAEACLKRLLETEPEPHFASVDAGLRGYKARHNLAVLYRRTDRDAEALNQWRQALDECPDFVPAWLGTAEIHLRQQEWQKVEEVAVRLEGIPGGEAPLLRARSHLARKEFGPARSLLEGVIARHPGGLAPRLVLSHVLLQEGTDLDAAERALRAVLELAPDHPEASHNLALLLRQKGQAARDALFTADAGLADPVYVESWPSAGLPPPADGGEAASPFRPLPNKPTDPEGPGAQEG
jgi:GT2 family glycosyltransferase/predicted Zn-dependent protease